MRLKGVGGGGVSKEGKRGECASGGEVGILKT